MTHPDRIHSAKAGEKGRTLCMGSTADSKNVAHLLEMVSPAPYAGLACSNIGGPSCVIGRIHIWETANPTVALHWCSRQRERQAPCGV